MPTNAANAGSEIVVITRLSIVTVSVAPPVRAPNRDLFVVSGGVEGTSPADYQDPLYLNDGKGVFTRAQAGTLPDDAVSGSCACASDLDRDGDLDLFVGGRSTPARYPLSPGSR